MTPFEKAWHKTGRAEGGYSENRFDSGGPTNHGITEAVARANGYGGDMRDLPASTALDIAKLQYWNMLRLDEIASLSDPIAAELFDSGINCGQATAARWLQEGLNCFNRNHRVPPDYPELIVDRNIGPMTVWSLAQLLKRRGAQGELVMLRFLNCEQGAFYNSLRKRRIKDEEFTFGWYLHRVMI